jgi:hypothetical protein
MREEVMRKQKDLAGKEIARLWGDVPVTDAEKDLRVFIASCDLEGATRKDPAHCVFARACQRVFGARKILFFRRVAYVELPGKDGQKRVERFLMGREMKRLVKDFDEGRTTIPEAGFVLHAPPRSGTLEGQAERRRQNKDNTKKERHERQKLKGTRLPDEEDSLGRYSSEGVIIDLDVRSGTGAVHFAKTTTKDKKDGSEKTSGCSRRKNESCDA